MVDQTRCSSRSACTNLGEAWRRRRSVGFFRLKPSDAESKAAGARLAPAPHRCESLEADVARDLDHQRPNCRDARLHGYQRRRLYDPRVDPPNYVPNVTPPPHASPSPNRRVAAFSRSRVPNSPRFPATTIQHLFGVLFLLLGAGSLSGCAFYGFTGASIPSHLETIAIPIAQDNTSSPLNTMGSDLTGLLTDRFVDRTSLSLTTNDSGADALLSARIQRYRNRPTGVSGDERATTNEVTIAVQVRYVDQKRDSVLVDQSFRGASSYDPVEAGLQGERQAAQNALQNVADDIFSTATSNW